MKTLRIIQKVFMCAAFITGLSLIDNVNYADMWIGFLLVTMVMLQIIIRQVYIDLKKND